MGKVSSVFVYENFQVCSRTGGNVDGFYNWLVKCWAVWVGVAVKDSHSGFKWRDWVGLLLRNIKRVGIENLAPTILWASGYDAKEHVTVLRG